MKDWTTRASVIRRFRPSRYRATIACKPRIRIGRHTPPDICACRCMACHRSPPSLGSGGGFGSPVHSGNVTRSTSTEAAPADPCHRMLGAVLQLKPNEAYTRRNAPKSTLYVWPSKCRRWDEPAQTHSPTQRARNGRELWRRNRCQQCAGSGAVRRNQAPTIGTARTPRCYFSLA